MEWDIDRKNDTAKLPKVVQETATHTDQQGRLNWPEEAAEDQ